MSADEITPNCAPLVAHALGADRAAAFDVGAACTGFLAGLAQAAALVEVGRAERVLLIGAETLTRLTDFHDKKTGMLFGDGAGAAVHRPVGSPAPASARSTCWPTAAWATRSWPRSRTARSAWTASRRSRSPSSACRSRRSTPSPPRASSSTTSTCSSTTRPTPASSSAVGERLDLEPAKVADYISQLGNTSAASVPLTPVAGARGRPAAPGPQGAAGARSARASPGAPA